LGTSMKVSDSGLTMDGGMPKEATGAKQNARYSESNTLDTRSFSDELVKDFWHGFYLSTEGGVPGKLRLS